MYLKLTIEFSPYTRPAIRLDVSVWSVQQLLSRQRIDCRPLTLHAVLCSGETGSVDLKIFKPNHGNQILKIVLEQYKFFKLRSKICFQHPTVSKSSTIKCVWINIILSRVNLNAHAWTKRFKLKKCVAWIGYHYAR